MITVTEQPISETTPLSNYPSVRSFLGRTGIETVKGAIQSDNYVSGTTGWKISAAGSIEAMELTLTGGNISYGKTSFSDATNAGYHISSSGFYFGSASDAKYIKYNISTGALDFAGTLSSALGTVVLNTTAKTILKDFTFASTDYSGALKTGDITWNTTTGAITGGSGIVINKGGIVGAASGVATFTISGTTGSASFSGSITASTITGTTITGGTVQTAATGSRVTLSGNYLNAIDSSNVTRLVIQGTHTPVIFYDDDGTQQANLRVRKATGTSASYNHNGSLGIEVNYDFYIHSGHNGNKSCVSFMASFDDGRVPSNDNPWMRFRVNNTTTDDDYNLSLFAKTFINPNVITTGISGTVTANHLIVGIGTSFDAGDVGKIIWNRVDDTFATIIAYNSPTDVTLSADIFDTATGEGWEMFEEPTAYLDINSDVLRLRVPKTPSSAADTGNKGDICWDADYIYVCIDTDTWTRAAIATW